MCLEGEDAIARRLDASGRWPGTSGRDCARNGKQRAVYVYICARMSARVPTEAVRGHQTPPGDCVPGGCDPSTTLDRSQPRGTQRAAGNRTVVLWWNKQH